MCQALREGLAGSEPSETDSGEMGLANGEKPRTYKLVKTRLAGALLTVRINMWVLVLHIDEDGK